MKYLEMFDPHGVITFTKSTDCVFDMQKMMVLLNTFAWDSSRGAWECDGNWLVRSGGLFTLAKSPFAIPGKVISYTVLTVGVKKVQKVPSAMTPDDWENIIEEEQELPLLSDLSKAISPLIENGWIEIACVAHNNKFYVYSESMRVYADGKVLTRRSQSGPFQESSHEFEEYVPVFTTNQSNKGEDHANV